jgi:predicted 3-demethylubiquinone-9 3-methyltransferase (glyoxalase superfamily)
MATLSKIRPCLWFDKEAEDAAKFYTGIFPNSKITYVSRYVAEGQAIHKQEEGSVMMVAFELNGQHFTALNGGSQFKFNEAVSFMVSCDTQEELDHYWSKLSADPKSEICGWCKDKFGLSWQIVHSGMDEMMTNASEAQLSRVMKVVMASKKLDIAKLKEAYDG